MHTATNYLTALIICIPLFLTNSAGLYARDVKSIEVFTTTSSPVAIERTVLEAQNISIQYYELDLWVKLEQHFELNAGINPLHDAVKRAHWLSKNHGARLTNSYTGLAKAQAYGLSLYPAIVVNGESILYGLARLQSALAIYRQHHAK